MGPCFLLFGLMNIYATIFNFYVMACPYDDYGYIDDKHSNYSCFLLDITVMTSSYYRDFQKFMFTCASLSGPPSYFYMVCSLNTKYIKSIRNYITKKAGYGLNGDNKTETENKEGQYPISPFSLETALKPKQVRIFWSIFSLNLAIYLSSAFVFFYNSLHDHQ